MGKIKKVDAWLTTDNEIWSYEIDAKIHQKNVDGEKGIRSLWFDCMVECASDLIDFLNEHKKLVLGFYGMEEK